MAEAREGGGCHLPSKYQGGLSTQNGVSIQLMRRSGIGKIFWKPWGSHSPQAISGISEGRSILQEQISPPSLFHCVATSGFRREEPLQGS